jgi:hypothetical protein
VADAGVALELEQAEDPAPSRSRLVRLREKLDVVAVGIALVPLVVAAVVLVFGVGGRYLSTSDLALEEMATRDIGRHPVLVGLHSRGTWSHPGPLLNYLLLPFYWLTGGRSIGIHLGALAINGASIAGMALLARRHGGRALLLCTLVGLGLVLRTTGAHFVNDPWVCYITTLPFGLLLMLSWSMVCGERRALPYAVFVASFLAQTHVGFVALAPPLLLWGVAWLLVPGWRTGEAERRRDLRRTSLVAGAVLAVVWSPLLLDAWFNSPSNTGNVWRWFGEEEEFGFGTHTMVDGWHVLTGQFYVWPEWLTSKLHLAFPLGETSLLYDHDTPWLLLPVAFAAGVAWRWRQRLPAAFWLVATLAVALVAGIVAVARTVGPVFDYRMRWTWVLAMLAIAFVVWLGWLALRDRWPGVERRWLVPGALVALVVVSGVNTFTAATMGTPYEGDSEIVGSLTEQVEEIADPDGGPVVVEAPFQMGMWWSRGLVLHLERRGFEVKVATHQAVQYEFGHQHRRYEEGEPVQMWLHVVRDAAVPGMEATPDVEPVARWTGNEPTGLAGADEVVVFRDHGREEAIAEDREEEDG